MELITATKMLTKTPLALQHDLGPLPRPLWMNPNTERTSGECIHGYLEFQEKQGHASSVLACASYRYGTAESVLRIPKVSGLSI